MKASFVRAACIAGGLLYILTGLPQLFAPQWFYQTIGTFPPFNRHYTGDLGSFLLPLGIALLWAARNPAQNRLLIGFAALGSLLHGLNHAYDDVLAQSSLSGWFSQTIPLLIFALVLVAVYFSISPARSQP